MAKGRGGARPGAGRKPGTKNKSTLEQKATLSEIARGYSQQAIETLVDVMINSDHTSARVTAANSILDRGYGRPKIDDGEQADEAPSKMTFKIEVSDPVKSVRVTKAQ